MSKVLQLFSCSVSLCDTIQLNTIDENRVQGLGVLSGRTGSQIIWPLILLERHSQVVHTGFYTQWHRARQWKKKRWIHIGFYTQCSRVQRTIWGNSYQPLHSMKNMHPCLPMYSGWGISNEQVVWKEPVFYFGQVLIVTRSQRIRELLTKLQ